MCSFMDLPIRPKRLLGRDGCFTPLLICHLPTLFGKTLQLFFLISRGCNRFSNMENPTMICLSIFAVSTIFPFCWVLLSSFKSTTEIYGNSFALPEVWQFENYVTAWKGAGMSYSFLNSFIYELFNFWKY